MGNRVGYVVSFLLAIGSGSWNVSATAQECAPLFAPPQPPLRIGTYSESNRRTDLGILGSFEGQEILYHSFGAVEVKPLIPWRPPRSTALANEVTRLQETFQDSIIQWKNGNRSFTVPAQNREGEFETWFIDPQGQLLSKFRSPAGSPGVDPRLWFAPGEKFKYLAPINSLTSLSLRIARLSSNGELTSISLSAGPSGWDVYQSPHHILDKVVGIVDGKYFAIPYSLPNPNPPDGLFYSGIAIYDELGQLAAMASLFSPTFI